MEDNQENIEDTIIRKSWNNYFRDGFIWGLIIMIVWATLNILVTHGWFGVVIGEVDPIGWTGITLS